MSPANQRQRIAQVAERIRLARSLSGLSQEAAARDLGVTVRTYARWERAETQGFMGELDSIAKVLHTTPEELRGPTELEGATEGELAALRAEVAELRQLTERILAAVEPED